MVSSNLIHCKGHSEEQYKNKIAGKFIPSLHEYSISRHPHPIRVRLSLQI